MLPLFRLSKQLFILFYSSSYENTVKINAHFPLQTNPSRILIDMNSKLLYKDSRVVLLWIGKKPIGRTYRYFIDGVGRSHESFVNSSRLGVVNM